MINYDKILKPCEWRILHEKEDIMCPEVPIEEQHDWECNPIISDCGDTYN